MSTFGLRWRFFWSRRSRRRTSLAVLLALVSLLAITYVEIPATWQLRVQDGMLAVGRGIRSLGPTNALLAGVALCLIVSLLLIFVPTYRRHGYLTTARHIVPPVSVYLDAENQLSEAAIRPFTDFLVKHLDGRRADLLYFLDASKTAHGAKYKTLYRFGFRPVDVPHDPTGKGHVKEAVDKELAMHAVERAILGPADQEFIIVTGDGDFVPLIYRLVALGHRVQIWAAPIRDAYKVIETYLGINVIDLQQVLSGLETTSPEEASPQTTNPTAKPSTKKKKNTGKSKSQPIRVDSVSPARIVAPASLSRSSEEQFYFAISETLAARAHAQLSSRSDTQRHGNFYSLLRGKYAPRLASIGYSAGNWMDYWVEHLKVLGILSKDGERLFPIQGPGSVEEAARSLSVMAERAARAALLVGVSHQGGLVRMSEVAAAIAIENPSSADDADPLLALVATGNGKRITHSRYFVRSARSLGLLAFDDVQDSLDVIGNPRLPAHDGDDQSRSSDDSGAVAAAYDASAQTLEVSSRALGAPAGESLQSPNASNPSGDISAAE